MEGDSLSPFYILTMILGLSFSLVAYLRLSVKEILGKLRAEIEYDIKVKGFKKLMEQSYLSHGDENTGSKAQKVQSGAAAFKSLTFMTHNQVFQAFTLFVSIIVIFIFLSPVYAFLFCL